GRYVDEAWLRCALGTGDVESVADPSSLFEEPELARHPVGCRDRDYRPSGAERFLDVSRRIGLCRLGDMTLQVVGDDLWRGRRNEARPVRDVPLGLCGDREVNPAVREADGPM